MELVRRFGSVAGAARDKMRKENLFETARFFCDVYVLGPGQSQPVHAHAGSDKVYATLFGRGTVHVGDRAVEVAPGVAVLCPAGSPHGVENPGPEELRLLVFMAPHPKPPPSA